MLPDDAMVQEHLADLYRALQLYPLAGTAYRKALQINPDNPAGVTSWKALPND
ncbi:MAG: hypothetical protein R2864_06315 [Syntrophotaleaceae bacterium]